MTKSRNRGAAVKSRSLYCDRTTDSSLSTETIVAPYYKRVIDPPLISCYHTVTIVARLTFYTCC